MVLKLIVFVFLTGSTKVLCNLIDKVDIVAETPIDKAWWDSLSEQWKTILLINQNFQKQRSDIFELQEGYINRLNSKNEDDYSETNKSLHELFAMKKFSLGYADFYARALKYKFATPNTTIDLTTLSDLDKIYMVNGPGDLTPLKKFPNLKVLILTDCGIDNAISVKSQLLNLEPLRYLNKLQVLHCSSNALQSVEPIKDLVDLQELRLDNSSVTDLSPLQKLVNLEVLSVGSNVETAPVIAGFIKLKALYLNGIKRIPDLSKLQHLQKLSVEENDFAIIDNNYRIKNIDFLKALINLEYLDLDNTSYKGDLNLLDSFQNLKAITFPPVNKMARLQFKNHHQSCVIINAAIYE